MRIHLRRNALVFTILATCLGLALAIQGMAQAVTAEAAATDPAYAAGYRAGFPLGQNDQAASAEANAHKFRIYQDGTDGYTTSYGTPEAYRRAFQSGFNDGYQDAFSGRRPALALIPPAAATPATPAAVEAVSNADTNPSTVARANGYREGYSVGEADANRSANYNDSASREYQQAMIGYRTELGAANQYQLNFRGGFSTGYGDGYHHRLYNAQIGARSPAPVALADAAAAPAPTASGVYGQTVQVAEGTRVQGTLDRRLDTKTAQAGDRFSLTVSVPVWVGAMAAIPAGSTIQGTVQRASRGGKLSGNAQLQLQFTTLTVPGQAPVPFYATTTGVGADAQNVGNVDSQEGTVTGQSAETGKHAATGAAIGAVLGGIFGGGSGILRGGAAGAAAGTAGVLLSHKKDLVLDQGETINLKLDRPLQLPKN